MRYRLLLAALAVALSACGSTLYSSEGLPPLQTGGGGPPCDTSYFCDVGGSLQCVAHDPASHCGAACTPCPAQVANGNPWSCDPAGQDFACNFSCRDGLLKNAGAQSCEAAAALAAGDGHTCAITATGLLKCWGNNAQGQVTGAAGALVTVPHDLAVGVTAAAAGPTYTCAVIAGGVRCFGAAPAGAPPAAGAVALAAGANHACALLAGATVQCWGTGPAASAPSLTGVSLLTSGANHACALDGAGAVHCWGLNDQAQLGTATPTATSATPLASGYTYLAAGRNHTCAATPAVDSLLCWGANPSFSNASGTFSILMTSLNPQVTPAPPLRVSGNGRVITNKNAIVGLGAGGSHTCFVIAPAPAVVDVGLSCFGLDADGQLGTGVAFGGETVPITGSASPIAAAAGGSHTCAVFSSGQLSCWGANASSQLGNGSTTPAATPVLVSGK